MRSAKEALLLEAITLPVEVRNRLIRNLQISFQFEDGTMHHVKPSKIVSKKLARDCLKNLTGPRYKPWSFLDEEDMII